MSIPQARTETVASREGLAQFVEYLMRDLHANPETWENVRLEDFLEALAAYIRDVPGYYQNFQMDVDPDVPSWRLFADVLAGATIYE